MKTYLIKIALLGGLVNVAQAQSDFQLPRECLERQVPDPSKCVIQDGPPHRVYPATRNLNKPVTTKPVTPPGTNTTTAAPRASFTATR